MRYENLSADQIMLRAKRQKARDDIAEIDSQLQSKQLAPAPLKASKLRDRRCAIIKKLMDSERERLGFLTPAHEIAILDGEI